MKLVLKDHITVVVVVKSLNQDSHECYHGKSSIVDFLVLVVNPTGITVINPVGGTEKVTRLVSRTFLDLFSYIFGNTTSEEPLDPANSRKLLSSFEGVAGELAVESGVDTGGSDVPSQACSHSYTSVLEFRLTVVLHGGIILALGKTKGVEVSHGGGDSNDSIILPSRQRSVDSGL